ncbi:WD domain G-beta repeat domain-containing protein, partial [Phytophthora infestans]
SSFLRAPLESNGDKLSKALHFDTRLGHDAEDRSYILKSHNKRALATIPSIMTQLTVDKVKDVTQPSSILPISHIDVTGCVDSTVVTSVFMSEIPHPSLEDVYAGALAFFDFIPTSLKHHFRMNVSQSKLNDEASPVYWQMNYESAGGLPATVNQVLCSGLTTTHATVHLDTITNDPLYPSNSVEFGICGLTLTPRIESSTDKTESVTLRWTVVYRYNMLPGDPALQKHVEMIRPIFNGDLITASDPFVEVIKFGMTHRNVGWYTQGDVEEIQDQHIHKNVFKIRGAIAATNYLRVPRDAVKGTHGLGLTGRYAYLQLRRIGDLPMTIHLDFVTNRKTALRFALSSIYQLFRSTGTVLRVPLSLDTRWTVVVVDMARLLELHSFNQYARETYRHLKTITLCASMNLRNFFVSPTLYTPTTLPSSLRFPGDSGDLYGWLKLPPDDDSSLGHDIHPHSKQEDLRIAATPTPVRTRRHSHESTSAVHHDTKTEESPPTHEVQAQVSTQSSPRTRDANIRRDRNDILSKADQILRDAGVFLTTESANTRESIDAAYQSPLRSPTSTFAPGMKQGLRTRIVSSSTKAEWPDPILELDRIIGFSNDFARVLLWVPDGSACVYTSSSTIVYREFCAEYKAKSSENNTSMEAAKGSMETSGSTTATREHFLHGHLSAVCALAATTDGRFLASAEIPKESKQNGIRLWNLATRDCITIIKAQAKGVPAMCFSPLSKRRLVLCVVGRDECFRTQIFIWDCTSLLRGTPDPPLSATVSLMARQTSDFPIEIISFSPYEQQDHYHLVSCGRENIRYWRVNPNTGHLTGCPVILNEYSRGTVFTDIGFDTIVDSHPSNIHRVRPLYVSSSLGTLLVIDYDLKQVICVYQLHDASINCLSVNEGFCVTGSDDCFLRVWPLDFTDFFLEAQHEAGVSCLDVSADGMKVIVGSRNNAIGVLDIASQQYATLLRSHTKKVTALAPAPWRSPLTSLLLEDTCGVGTESELVTASDDGTLRVWDTLSGHQLYEFDIQQDPVTSVAASPVKSGIVAVGFASGYTRIFDVHRTAEATGAATDEVPSSMLHEFRQHQSSIRHIAFDTDAQHLFTSGGGKQLCLYDARQQDYLPLKMLLADFDPEDGCFEVSYDKKWLALVSSDRQSVVMLDPCSLRVISTVRPPKQGKEEILKLARFSNHSSELLVLSSNDRLHIFSLPGRELVQSMPLLGQDGISALVVSANAKYMATGGADGSLRVWNWDDRGRIGRMNQSFLGHTGKINELAFTEGGKSIVTAGESNAICVWQFHGDSSPSSPREKSGPLDGRWFNLAGGDDENDMNDENTNGDQTLSANVTAASSKANFKLRLDADALMLNAGGGAAQRGSIDSLLTDFQEIDVPATSVTTTSVCGDIALCSVVGGFNPSKFAWSYSTGKLLTTTGSVLVVEDIASGERSFRDDICSLETDHVEEIVVMQLSPSGQQVATISSRFDGVVVRSVSRCGGADTSKENDRVLIPLLPDTRAVTCLTFAQCSIQGNGEDLICMACEASELQNAVVAVASTIQRRIIWSSLNSNGILPTDVRRILATSASHFLLLQVSAERSSIYTLNIQLDEKGKCSDKVPKAEIKSLIGIFPTQVQLVSLFNKEGTTDRLRYLVGIDNDRYCYFYDLHRSTFIATSQLFLLPPTMKKCSNQVDGVGSSRKVVEFMEWVTSAAKSLLITGSTTENVLYVHGLPMLSTKHSGRVQVDWQRMARAGVPLLCKIALNGGGLLRSISVDPARDLGIACTADGTAVLVHFDASPTTKVLRETPPLAASTASWALEGAVVLSTAANDNAIRVWLPELAKEIAAFQVDSAVCTCTCFAVNPFSDGIAQSMVMAGYSDGSFRVFDLCEMRLLSRFELTPSSGNSSRHEGASIDRIVFVGPSNALIVTNRNCVLLVNIFNALEPSEGHQPTRDSNVHRTPPKRAISRSTKKTLQERSRTKLKPQAPRGKKADQEVVYREIVLLPSSYIRQKRLPGLAKSKQVHVAVGGIEVMESSDAGIHPFLIVVKYTGPVRYGEGRCMVKVFADPAMNASNEDEIAPTDEWRLNIRPTLDQGVATFVGYESGSVQVLYPLESGHDSAPTSSCSWGLELRDCVQQRVIQRFSFGTSDALATPLLLRNINARLPNEPEAAEMLLLVDREGRMAGFDVRHGRLHPVNSQTLQHLRLRPCSISKSTFILTAPTQLAVANLTFH